MRLLLVLALVLAVAAPAVADTAETPPTLRTERTWFHCAGTAKVQNAEYAQRNVPSWTTAAPTQSVQQGAGCGYYENAGGGYLGPNETTLDSIWEGNFTGNLDSITVELHNIHASAARTGGTFKLRANLLVDGVDVLDPDAPQIEVVPVPSSTKLSEMLRFTVTGIGMRTEEGDGQRVRRIRLIVRSLSEEQSAWVWDTTEVPAGLTFNPAAPEAVKVPARPAG